eukprot:Clim_evm33s88 gene=Clim_evmTU33s88
MPQRTYYPAGMMPQYPQQRTTKVTTPKDETGAGLEDLVQGALKQPQDRVLVMQVEQMLNNLLDHGKEGDSLEFPSLHSFHRMLVHKIAAYYKMEHETTADFTKTVVVTRVAKSRKPEKQLSSMMGNVNVYAMPQGMMMPGQMQNFPPGVPMPQFIPPNPQFQLPRPTTTPTLKGKQPQAVVQTPQASSSQTSSGTVSPAQETESGTRTVKKTTPEGSKADEEIPFKVKIMQRKAPGDQSGDEGSQGSPLVEESHLPGNGKSVEQREEEYRKAKERIFSRPSEDQFMTFYDPTSGVTYLVDAAYLQQGIVVPLYWFDMNYQQWVPTGYMMPEMYHGMYNYPPYRGQQPIQQHGSHDSSAEQSGGPTAGHEQGAEVNPSAGPRQYRPPHAAAAAGPSAPYSGMHPAMGYSDPSMRQGGLPPMMLPGMGHPPADPDDDHHEYASRPAPRRQRELYNPDAPPSPSKGQKGGRKGSKQGPSGEDLDTPKTNGNGPEEKAEDTDEIAAKMEEVALNNA